MTVRTGEPLQATLKFAKDNLEKDYEYCKHILWSYKTKLKLFGHRNTLMLGEGRETEHPWWNKVVGAFHCVDASMCLELWLSSRWKESWRKKDMLRFWKKTSNSQQQNWVLVISLSSNKTTIQNTHRTSWWRTTFRRPKWILDTESHLQLRSIPDDHQIWRRFSNEMFVRLAEN